MNTYIICADGACSGNPGPGGYAWEIWLNQVREGNQFSDGRGLSINTTNNIMELTAIYEALKTMYENEVRSSVIKLRLDSEYVLKGMFEWMPNWKARNWRNSQKKPVANQELWRAIDALMLDLEFKDFILKPDWVRGHNGDIGNERVDRQAVFMRDQASVEAHRNPV